jgi:hypothetical protein
MAMISGARSGLSTKADRGTTVLHSMDQVKQLLLSRGVSPEQFGRALLEPMPPMIEHEDHGEKKR